MPGQDWEAEELYKTLADMIDKVENLMDYAEDMGYRAVQHKLQETWGPLNSATAAARQYADGELNVRA